MTVNPGIKSMLIAGGFMLASLSGHSEKDPPWENSLVEWKIAHFTAQELRDGTSGDYRALTPDQLPNLLKYTMGLSPWETIGTPVLIERSGNTLIASHSRAEGLTDATCRLEISGDLDSWTTAESQNPTTPVSSRVSRFVFTTTIPHGNPRFFRLRAERLTYDLDGDSLNDDQELAWFASIDHGPSDDPDGDGMTTAKELALGRSPHRGVITDPDEALTATGLVVFAPLEPAATSIRRTGPSTDSTGSPQASSGR